MEFLGHRRAAHHAAPLEHRHFETGSREIGRTDESVVSAADDDDIARL